MLEEAFKIFAAYLLGAATILTATGTDSEVVSSILLVALALMILSRKDPNATDIDH